MSSGGHPHVSHAGGQRVMPYAGNVAIEIAGVSVLPV